MKTKIFLLMGLFLCLNWTNTVAQDNAKNAEQSWSESTTYYEEVYCDGQLVDVLEGGITTVHRVRRLIWGVSYMDIMQVKGEVTSQKNGEVFQIIERDHFYNPDHTFEGTWFIDWHFNLRGNLGTHYIGTVTINTSTWEVTSGKAVCLGESE